MKTEIEIEKSAIALDYVNRCFNEAIVELAAARVEIRQLKAKIDGGPKEPSKQ